MRRLFFFIGIVFILLATLEYIKYRREFINSLDIIIKIVEENENPQEFVKLYLLNGENKFEEVNVEIENTIDDVVEYIFQLYTSKSNSLSLGFYTPINVSTELLDLYYDEEIINIVVNDDFYRTVDINSFFGLMWSYNLLGYKEVNIINQNNEKINLKFKDYQKINLIIESNQSTSFLTTIFYPTTHGTQPISYLHNQENTINFIFQKYLNYVNVDTNKIIFSNIISNGKIYLDINDPEKLLTNEIILAIRRTLLFNNLYDDVIIIRNSEVFS